MAGTAEVDLVLPEALVRSLGLVVGTRHEPRHRSPRKPIGEQEVAQELDPLLSEAPAESRIGRGGPEGRGWTLNLRLAKKLRVYLDFFGFNHSGADTEPVLLEEVA